MWPNKQQKLVITAWENKPKKTSLNILAWLINLTVLKILGNSPSFDIMIGTEKTCEEQLFTTVLAA